MGMYLGGQRVLPIIDIQVQGEDSGGQYLVRVIDYDGTVLKQDHLDGGATFKLPKNPSHAGLVFDGWSSPVTISNGVVTVGNSDITIGAMYHTASGLSEFDISGALTVTLNMDGTKNWGDGTSDTSTTHTYASAGDYTITCNGSTMTTSSSSGLFGQNSNTPCPYVKDVRLGSNVTSIGEYAFQYCYSLTSTMIPEGVTSIDTYAFASCYSLTSITIPSSVTSIDSSVFGNCSSLTSITIPEGVISIGSYAFNGCFSLISIIIPEGVTSIDDRMFTNCTSLRSITIPEGVISIDTYAFAGCPSLTSITIPSSVTSIGSNVFSSCHSILEYDFSNSAAVPTLSDTNAFTGINKICKIKVPVSLESQWKAETNWSTYADYIVGV